MSVSVLTISSRQNCDLIFKPRSHLAEYSFRLFMIEINSGIREQSETNRIDENAM